MPKNRRIRSASFDRHSPFPGRQSQSPRSSATEEGASSSSSFSYLGIPPRSLAVPADNEFKEWDEIRCPVCMEQPHNTVLLICSSHDKGCRPFLCDTSYRHSNCLDQYRKAFDASAFESDGGSMAKFPCPLCRGVVSDCMVVQAARKYLNAKVRSCSSETCGFSGAYEELRKHARTEHPFVRPSEVDSVRQEDWRRMELQRDLDDFASSIESAIDGWDGGSGFLAEGREFVSFFPLPTITFLLILSFQGSGALGGRSSVRRESSRSPRRQREAAMVFSGEAFNGAEASGRFQRNHEHVHESYDDDANDESDDDAGHEEALDASSHSQRQMQ